MANFPIGGVPASRRRKTTFPRIIGWRARATPDPCKA